MLIEYFKQIPDFRRAAGRQYQLYYVLLFTIFAVLCGFNEYREITIFISAHFDKLDELYNMGWVRAPSKNTIINVIQGIRKEDLELVLRQYSEDLQKSRKSKGHKCIAIDGKRLKGSFDNVNNKKALHLLSIFDTDLNLILGHYDTEEKSNEIPAVIKLLEEMGLSGYIITLDALHCQKKPLKQLKNQEMRQ